MATRAAKKGGITLEQATAIIPATCAKCGADGAIYPYPKERGTMFCPACSPAWLKSFLEFSTATLRAELGLSA